VKKYDQMRKDVIPLNPHKTIMLCVIVMLKRANIKGTNISGPQSPVINITKSITLLNFKATIIAKLPIMTLVILAINNNFF
jgi:hypothetical protein